VDVGALVREVCALIGTAITTTADVRLELDENPTYVTADSSQLQQVIMNLLMNAGEAIPPGRGGTITVRTQRVAIDEAFIRGHRLAAAEQLEPGDYLCFEVEDNGCGMDASTLERIFDPFFTTKFTGRGLGLSAVLGIVRGHRGALGVTSALDRGTTFSIYLPISPAPPAEPESLPPLRHSQTGQLILVVDDEEVVRRTARTALELHGYRVLLAESGAEGIAMFRRFASEIAAVLLDLTMPSMDGKQTLEELQRIEPRVRVIVSSGFDQAQVEGRFAGRKVAGFIQKPYQAPDLVDKVAECLEPLAAADDKLR
jgi:CheY-like chemotaxis protein